MRFAASPDGTVSRRGSRHTPGRRVPNAVWPTSRTVSAVDSGRVDGRVRQADRVADRPDRAAHRHLRVVPLAGVAAHADHDQHRDLVRHQQRRQRVQRVAEPARLQHHRGPGPAEIQAGGNAEGLFLPRRQRGGDVREALAQDAQHVRQRIVGNVDDVTAAGGVEARAHARRPAGLDGHPRSLRHPREAGSGEVHLRALRHGGQPSSGLPTVAHAGFGKRERRLEAGYRSDLSGRISSPESAVAAARPPSSHAAASLAGAARRR